MRVYYSDLEDDLFTDTTVQSETVVSKTLTTEHMVVFCARVTITGESLNGSAKIEASNDGVVWFDEANSEQTISAADTYAWNIYDVGYKYMRISVTADINVITIASADVHMKGG